MADCVFCMIANHEIPTNAVYEDDKIICFDDLEPQAPVHVLVIPKKHIECIDALTEEDGELVGRILKTIPALEDLLELKNGYRLIINQGDDAGQTVPHLHIHILSGQKMGWQPA